MIRLEIKNYNAILIEKLPKYWLYHQAKLISMNILLVKKFYPSNQQKIIEQAKFTYSPIGKVFEKQTKKFKDQWQKQVEALKDLTKRTNKSN